MPTLKAVHRPQTIDEALHLLNRGDTRTAVLAGGTSLVPHLDPTIEELVDLQAIGLQIIEHSPDQMQIGALTTLQTIVDDEAAPELIRRLANREGPNTFRHAATVGGVVAGGDADSELLAAFLVCNAHVTIQNSAGVNVLPLANFLSERNAALRAGIITTLTLQKPVAAAHERVARTPQDKPIVAAVAARSTGGDPRLALCGVAAVPILVHLDEIADLNPPGDFRGSSAYRQEMAAVLARRALANCS